MEKWSARVRESTSSALAAPRIGTPKTPHTPSASVRIDPLVHHAASGPAARRQRPQTPRKRAKNAPSCLNTYYATRKQVYAHGKRLYAQTKQPGRGEHGQEREIRTHAHKVKRSTLASQSPPHAFSCLPHAFLMPSLRVRLASYVSPSPPMLSHVLHGRHPNHVHAIRIPGILVFFAPRENC